jgi:hypothetical protein
VVVGLTVLAVVASVRVQRRAEQQARSSYTPLDPSRLLAKRIFILLLACGCLGIAILLFTSG